MKSPIIILIFLVLVFITLYFIYKSNICVNKIKGIKGICYFDIDDTLSTAIGDRNEMMKQCLDNNFDIGIITASSRKIEDICDGDKAKVSWMPDLLCKQFKKNDGHMFNSTNTIAGKKVLPKGYPSEKDHGYIKGFDMKYGRDTFYRGIPDKCIVLFDDQQPVIDGVHTFNSNLETQCSNKSCGLGHALYISTVKEKVEYMKKNGCK